jgi:hypothetical protein
MILQIVRYISRGTLFGLGDALSSGNGQDYTYRGAGSGLLPCTANYLITIFVVKKTTDFFVENTTK